MGPLFLAFFLQALIHPLLMENVLNNHLVNSDQMNGVHPEASIMQTLAELFSGGHFDQVIARTSELRELFPDSHLIPNAMGCAFMELGRLENAAKQFQIATRLNDKFAEPYYNFAVMQKRRGNLLEARRLAELAIERDRNMAKAYTLLAQCCEDLHVFSEAIRSYRFAARDNSTKHEAMTALVALLTRVGNETEALETGEELIRLFPDDEKALTCFAAAHIKFDQCAKVIGRLQELTQDNNPSWHLTRTLADALLVDGQTAEAIKGFLKALEIKPEDQGTLEALTKAYRTIGDKQNSLKCAEKWVSTDPQNATAQFELGMSHHLVGNNNKALIFAKNACALAPHFADAKFLLANIFNELELDAAAAEQYEGVITSLELVLEAHNQYASALQKLGRFTEAKQVLKKLLKLIPDYPNALNNMANIHAELGETEKAIDFYERAAALSLDGTCLRNLAHLYKLSGKNDKMRQTLLRAIKVNERDASAYLGYTGITKIKKNDPTFLKLITFAREMDDAFDNEKWHFALSKCYQDTGDTKEAFKHLELGNNLKAKAEPFNMQNERNVFELARRIQTNSADLKPIEVAGGECAIPIFIIGMPRSGTTMVERVLSSHSDVTGLGELDFMNSITREFPVVPSDDVSSFYRDLRKQIFSFLPECETLFLTEKTPANFRSLGLLKGAIPEAKFVYCARDARAVCWSNYKLNFKANGLGYGNDLDTLMEYYNLHVEYMDYWKTAFPNEIFYFDYEFFTENQKQVTESLLEFCGLSWQQACLEFHNNEKFVKTASHAQVRKKLYTGSSEAWRTYEEHLAPYFEKLKVEKLDPKGMIR